MKFVDQIEAALSSPDSSDAVRLWLWLKVSNGGECYVSDILEARLPNAIDAANRLYAAHRIAFHGPKVVAMPFVRSHNRAKSPLEGLTGEERMLAGLQNPKADGAKKAILDAERWVFDAFNCVREKHKLRALPETQRTRNGGTLRATAEFLLSRKIDPERFIEFAYQETRWQDTKFPSLPLIGGTWIQQQWADHEPVKKREHAGHSYEDPGSLREALIAAGFPAKSMGEAQVRNVLRMAKTHRVNPAIRSGHPDEEIEAMVKWTAENWGEDGGR